MGAPAPVLHAHNEQNIYPEGTPRRVRRQRTMKTTSKMSHAEILGLASPPNASPTGASGSDTTLEAERQAYLDDTQPCVDILAYWQVSDSFTLTLCIYRMLICIAAKSAAIPYSIPSCFGLPCYSRICSAL